jgi:hypothetical protein
MDTYRLLLALSLGKSQLLLSGPLAEAGNHHATVRVRGPLDRLTVSVAGVDAVLGIDPGAAWTEIPLHTPLLVEHAQYDIHLRGAAPQWLTTIPRSDTAKLRYRSDDLSYYRLNYGSSVGDVSWIWQTPEGEVSIGLEVFPTKLDYREDFEAIKDDMRRISRLLVTDITGVTGIGFTPIDRPQEAQVEWLEHVRRESQSLRNAMTMLLPRIREQVRQVELTVPGDRIRGRKLTSRRDSALLALDISPAGVTVRAAELTAATPLNGHLRWEVDRFISTAQAVVATDWFAAEKYPFREAIEQTLSAALEWRKKLILIPAVPRLPNLQTRLRDPLYARAFTSLRRLRLGLQDERSPELLGLKNLLLLYEYWIFLQLVELLRDRFTTISSASPSLIRELSGQIYLTKGIESRITLRDAAGHDINCYYNRAYGGLPTTGQRPDITIEFPPSHDLLLIDAKYRIGRTARYLDKYGMPGPEEEDINVLHRYRDAIVRPDHPRQRPVVGGLIAFPGSQHESYREHHFFKSWKTARIGGIPMLPGHIELMDEALWDHFLNEE